MKMVVVVIDKKEFLLESIIRAYIEHLEPIGSTQLKSMYDITYSPATIRGYFKKLGEEGYLAQEHISSGRTPTTEALKQHWKTKLNFKLRGINLRALEYYASSVGLSVFIKKEKSDVLKNILNVKSKYMILEFSSFAISVKYSDALYRFLNEMIGLDLRDITRVSKDVGAYEVYESINQTLQNSDFQIFNYKEFLNLALTYNFDEYTINSFLKGQILDELKEGLYFENLLPLNYIGICNYCKINNEDVKMLVIGELPKDYEYFYEKITTF
jgi:heat-inducible transcriptional repressor